MPDEPNDSAFGFSRASLISSATELGFDVRIDHQQIRRRRHHGDRREKFVDVELPFRRQRGGGRHQRAGRGHQQRIAVRRRFDGGLGADAAGGAGLIFDHYRLAPLL